MAQQSEVDDAEVVVDKDVVVTEVVVVEEDVVTEVVVFSPKLLLLKTTLTRVLFIGITNTNLVHTDI